MVLHAMKSACDQGHRVVYLDVEGGLNDALIEGIGLTQYLDDLFQEKNHNKFINEEFQ